MIDLTTRHPSLTPQDMIKELRPSARFAAARFDTYRPNPDFASQTQARDQLAQFAEAAGQGRPNGSFRLFRRAAPPGRGLYLDGGFGVGKTHLLASTYHASQQRAKHATAALMSFQDLMYLIGSLGMAQAVEAFKAHDLLLIDEFELDDPGNTHMANTFLNQLMPSGTSVVATSNTEAGALGQGRFNARDFERQIQGIAGHFDNLSIDGPDYRQRGLVPAQLLSQAELSAWQAQQDPATLALLSEAQLSQVLLAVHPSRFSHLLDGVSALGVQNLQPMPDQNAALRLVHFIDKLYDLGLQAAFTGAPLTQLFDEQYRHGAYAKKYSRALSRLSELLSEARRRAALPVS